MKKVVWITGTFGALVLAGGVFALTRGRTEDGTDQSEAVLVEQERTIDDLNLAMREIGTNEFRSLVADYQTDPWTFIGERPCVVDIYATWCGPCKKLAPVLDKIAGLYAGQIDFYKVDIDKAEELSTFYGIEAIPTLLFCSADGRIERLVGAPSEEALLEKIQALK